MSGASYNEQDFAQGGADAPLYNERTSEFMQAENQYSNIDSYKPKTSEEKERNSNSQAVNGFAPEIKN